MSELIGNAIEKPFFFLGRNLLILSGHTKNWVSYLSEVCYALVTPPLRRKETLLQLYQIGVKSTPIIIFSVSFAAAVTVLEYTYHVNLVIHSTALVPGFAALLILRELGAVITALLLTSRVGAGVASEVGSMQITEQIDALKLLNIDPIRFLVVPRFWAGVFSCIALVIFANSTCIFFTMLLSIKYLSFSAGSFISSMNHFASFKDFYLSLVKGAIYGGVIPVIGCYYGFNCKAGAEGVGKATTQTVVSNAVVIILLDFILTYLFSYLY